MKYTRYFATEKKKEKQIGKGGFSYCSLKLIGKG